MRCGTRQIACGHRVFDCNAGLRADVIVSEVSAQSEQVRSASTGARGMDNHHRHSSSASGTRSAGT